MSIDWKRLSTHSKEKGKVEILLNLYTMSGTIKDRSSSISDFAVCFVLWFAEKITISQVSVQ
jgi:hypothetical protein